MSIYVHFELHFHDVMLKNFIFFEGEGEGESNIRCLNKYYNGTVGFVHCGIDASSKNTGDYRGWTIPRDRSREHLGSSCKAPFE